MDHRIYEMSYNYYVTFLYYIIIGEKWHTRNIFHSKIHYEDKDIASHTFPDIHKVHTACKFHISQQ